MSTRSELSARTPAPHAPARPRASQAATRITTRLERLELPVLLELLALGGSDDPRALAERLARYLPTLQDKPTQRAETETPGDSTSSTASSCLPLLRKVARRLVLKGQLLTRPCHWQLTPTGQKRAELEQLPLVIEVPEPPPPISHRTLQEQLLTIGRLLGRDAAVELEHYDVIWREHPRSPRYSHVFEVQVSGSVDSALTRLLAAWTRFRSRPVLVVFDEHSERFARQRLETAFVHLLPVLQVVTAAEISRLYASLHEQAALLQRIGLVSWHE